MNTELFNTYQNVNEKENAPIARQQAAFDTRAYCRTEQCHMNLLLFDRPTTTLASSSFAFIWLNSACVVAASEEGKIE